jgi:hypothetical protein
MMKKHIWITLLLAIVFALLISGAVFAEGEEPPATPAAEEPAGVVEVQAVVETPVGTIGEEPAVDLPEEQEELPEAEIILVDDQGEALVMASQESADKINSADPRWIVGTTWYSVVADEASCYPGTSVLAGTCFVETGDFITFSINKMADTGMPTDGKLFVEAGTYTENVVIDGTRSLLSGLIGVDGSALTTINGNINITNNINGFILSGFTINGGISILDSSGTLLLEDLDVRNTSGTGIVIGEQSKFHTGAAMLKDVRSNENSSHGATLFATGNINVSNSSFDGNGGNGLRVESIAGTITLKGVTASRNTQRGIYNVNIGFTKTFTLQHIQVNDNGLHGVDVGKNTATGAFIADTVYALNNNTSGTTTPPIEAFKLTTNGAVTLKNVFIDNTANGDGLNLIHSSTTPVVLQNFVSRNNGKVGIRISSYGNISLTSVKSTANGTDGLRIRNYGTSATGTIAITSPTTAGAAGANDFSSNGGFGLDLQSDIPVNITLSNLNANGNGKEGLYVLTSGNLTISKTLPNWVNGFNDNGDNGIYTRVDGSVSLGQCEASGNGKSGVYFNNTAKTATVTGGRFDNNGDHGLYIISSGNVVLTDISSVSDNDADRSGAYYGIYIDSSANVIIRNTSKTASTSVGGNSGSGVSINNTGSVSITGVSAWMNGGDGVYIGNRVWPGGMPVTLTRIESIFNTGHGVYAYTAGSVTMQDIFTAENTSHGLQINGCVDDGSGGCLNLANVTLKGSSNAFSNNGQAGLEIRTKGSVNLSHVDVYGNDAGGVKIINTFNGSSTVTIGGKDSSKIDSNMGYGLWVESGGMIIVRNLTVQNTTDFFFGPHGAVHLTNKGPAKKGVTLGDVEIYNNEKTGLYINSDGPVSLQGVSSSYNSITSGWIDVNSSTNGVRERLSGYWGNEDRWHFNGESGSAYTITLTSSAFKPMLSLEDEWGNQLEMDENLDGDGTAVISFSPASDGEYILRVQASDWGLGVYELTFGGDIYDALYFSPFTGASIFTPAGVNISSSKTTFSDFGGNNADGLYVSSGASVTLVNVGANDNYYKGVYVEAPNGNASLGNNHPTRISTFFGNGAQGVMIISGGTITLNNRLMAIGNGNEGFYLVNNTALTPKTITIKDVQSIGNSSTGIVVRSLGNISMTNVEASGNAQIGASLDTEGNVSILGINAFSNNSEQGLNVAASGTISISGVFAEYNGSNGLEVESRGDSKTVMLKNTVLRWNGSDGLDLSARGKVTIDGLQSLMNQGSGFVLDPSYSGVSTLIKNSVFMGNDEYGIRIAFNTYTMTNTYYLANNQGGIYLYK